jgi:hypothetical protein
MSGSAWLQLVKEAELLSGRCGLAGPGHRACLVFTLKTSSEAVHHEAANVP